MNFIKKHKTNIIVLIFFVFFLMFSIKMSLKYKERYYSGKPTIGKISKVGVSNLYWSYEVKGQKYEGVKSLDSYSFLKEDEKYFVYYDPDLIFESSICLTEPYIDKLQFDSLYSKKMFVNFERGTEIISFDYNYKNKHYKRSHLVSIDEGIILFWCAGYRINFNL
jgi:hypothetical protein